MKLSDKINRLATSGTGELFSKVKEMEEKGIKILSLVPGDPDFIIHKDIQETAVKAIKTDTSYTNIPGTFKLRAAITEKLKKENNLKYIPEEIIISSGSKQILYMLFQSILNKEDEVIIPSPYWTSYSGQIEAADGTPVEVNTENTNYIFTAKTFKEHITPKTKAVIINSPSNPTGKIIPKEELRKIGEIAVKNNIYIISDEAYEYFAYTKPVVSIASLSEDIYKQTFTIQSCSKSFAMSGFRIGYMAGNRKIIEAMTKLQSQINSCPSSISQAAAIKAMRLGKENHKEVLKTFRKRAELTKKLIDNTKLTMEDVEGAFYAWINIENCLNKTIKNSKDFCNFVLEKKHVAIVPGSAFGKYGEKHIRISLTNNMEKIEEGIQKISELL